MTQEKIIFILDALNPLFIIVGMFTTWLVGFKSGVKATEERLAKKEKP